MKGGGSIDDLVKLSQLTSKKYDIIAKTSSLIVIKNKDIEKTKGQIELYKQVIIEYSSTIAKINNEISKMERTMEADRVSANNNHNKNLKIIKDSVSSIPDSHINAAEDGLTLELDEIEKDGNYEITRIKETNKLSTKLGILQEYMTKVDTLKNKLYTLNQDLAKFKNMLITNINEVIDDVLRAIYTNHMYADVLKIYDTILDIIDCSATTSSTWNPDPTTELYKQITILIKIDMFNKLLKISDLTLRGELIKKIPYLSDDEICGIYYYICNDERKYRQFVDDKIKQLVKRQTYGTDRGDLDFGIWGPPTCKKRRQEYDKFRTFS